MSIAASTVLSRARSLLNDVAAALWTDPVLLPFVNKAYEEMQEIFEDNDVSVQAETSATLVIPANTTSLHSASSPVIPTGLMFPIRIFERETSSSNLWQDMQMKRWEPNLDQQDTLRFWTWREEEIKFVGSTAIRDIKIDFYKELTEIASGATTIPINRSKNFLAVRTAQLASMMIGENESRAATLQQDAELAMERLVNRIVKMRQASPVRRLPFRVGRRTMYR